MDYLLLAIHSDVPFEQQLEAFKSDGERVKVVVATNAVESSVTIPDADTVICLGTEKRVEFNPRFNRVQLVHRWISRASATQRAGRTGRVRPVVRYYNLVLVLLSSST